MLKILGPAAVQGNRFNLNGFAGFVVSFAL